jgi:hypothetical protein
MNKRQSRRIRHNARAINTSPLPPLQPRYYDALTPFTAAQEKKVAEVIARAEARARKPYLKFIELGKKFVEQITRENQLTRRLTALLNKVEALDK